MSRQLRCLATQGHILILTCLWSGLIVSDCVKPVTRVVCHFWNANKTILFSKVSGVIDVKIYSNIIHFPLCFSRIDVISFHALLNALKELKKTWCFLSFKESKESFFFFFQWTRLEQLVKFNESIQLVSATSINNLIRDHHPWRRMQFEQSERNRPDQGQHSGAGGGGGKLWNCEP